ncbi:MAG: hypothetical protein DID92_2727743026 [Candidatus Nitrotoga sp. SPKER]|nr:MAG: hypothetical protein DID92_2727743026 [Candidatus Nitrotoga sp. SPKER]
MDYPHILKIRQNRETRKKHYERPLNNFSEKFVQCMVAGEKFLNEEVPSEYSSFVERSIIISSVTSIEMYYRDMLDFILKYCSPTFIEPRLKSLHAEKYSINDLVEMHNLGIHPLELISSELPFQNIKQIDKVFTTFFDKSFWSILKGFQVRNEAKPEKIYSWNDDDIVCLSDIFTLRHELVHEHKMNSFLTEEILRKLDKAGFMVWGTNFVLINMMMENKKT